ncbi:MAG: polysaccharide deacetylase family protein [Solirubrobacteraceae bacterium]
MASAEASGSAVPSGRAALLCARAARGGPAGSRLAALAGSRPVGIPASPAPIWPALRRALGVCDATPDGSGYALTFDDGPHPRGTPAVLECLAGAGARATFFLAGEQVERQGGLVGEIVAGGHEIGVHCHRHRNLLRLSRRAVREDLERAAALIEDAAGRQVRLYRPPYGVLTGAALRFAESRGWKTYMWSEWGRDWEARASADTITRRLTGSAASGGVGLLHDADHYSAPGSWERTVSALPAVLCELERRGLGLVTL